MVLIIFAIVFAVGMVWLKFNVVRPAARRFYGISEE
jgi:hypothetical protein